MYSSIVSLTDILIRKSEIEEQIELLEAKKEFVRQKLKFLQTNKMLDNIESLTHQLKNIDEYHTSLLQELSVLQKDFEIILASTRKVPNFSNKVYNNFEIPQLNNIKKDTKPCENNSPTVPKQHLPFCLLNTSKEINSVPDTIKHLTALLKIVECFHEVNDILHDEVFSYLKYVFYENIKKLDVSSFFNSENGSTIRDLYNSIINIIENSL